MDSTKFNTVLERQEIDDTTEVVLCDRGESVYQRYATWLRNLNTGDTYHGTYHSTVVEAGVKFTKRATRSPL